MAKKANRAKLAWLKAIDVVGTCASRLASNAKFKVAEINLETRKREIMTEVSQKSLEMWQSGILLPEPLNEMLQEYTEVGEQLSILCAQRYAAVASETKAAEDEDEDAPVEAVEPPMEDSETGTSDMEEKQPEFESAGEEMKVDPSDDE